MAKTVPADRKAYVVTGPTSGIGRCTAFKLSRHGTVVLVGRDRGKLEEVQRLIEKNGGYAASVACTLSEITRVRHAAADILALTLPVSGLVNNGKIWIGQTLMRVKRLQVGLEVRVVVHLDQCDRLTAADSMHRGAGGSRECDRVRAISTGDLGWVVTCKSGCRKDR